MEINVTKRDGSREILDLEKFHKVAQFACEGLAGVSVSDLEIKTHLQFYNNIKTVDIQETLIKAAADLITEDAPNYQFVAGRLINYGLRKEIYGQFEPPELKAHIIEQVFHGRYDGVLMDQYSADEVDVLNSYINHDRDFDLSYAAMEQMRGKYLVKNRVSGEIYETPQMAMMCIAMTLFSSYKKDVRLKWVKDLYRILTDTPR